MQTSPSNYIIKPRAQQKIRSFYQNVAKKYKHTYDFNDLVRDIDSAVMSVYESLIGYKHSYPKLVISCIQCNSVINPFC